MFETFMDEAQKNNRYDLINIHRLKALLNFTEDEIDTHRDTDLISQIRRHLIKLGFEQWTNQKKSLVKIKFKSKNPHQVEKERNLEIIKLEDFESLVKEMFGDQHA